MFFEYEWVVACSDIAAPSEPGGYSRLLFLLLLRYQGGSLGKVAMEPENRKGHLVVGQRIIDAELYVKGGISKQRVDKKYRQDKTGLSTCVSQRMDISHIASAFHNLWWYHCNADMRLLHYYPCLYPNLTSDNISLACYAHAHPATSCLYPPVIPKTGGDLRHIHPALLQAKRHHYTLA